MPRDSAGVYTLPNGYLATAGATIQPSQHNPPFEDVAQALTGSLPRNGSAAMTGPLRASSGDATSPGLALATGTGLFLTSGGGIGLAVGGVQVGQISSGGIAALPLGMPVPVLDDTLPGFCIWADGRNVSRTGYSRLFAKWGTKYGAGDGSTTFGMPDMRAFGLIGKDNFGGSDAGRLTSVPFTSGDRLTTGSKLGAAMVALLTGELPSHSHDVVVTYPPHAYVAGDTIQTSAGTGFQISIGGPAYAKSTTPPAAQTIASALAGSGTAHLNIQPSLACGWAIFAGE